MHFKRLFCFIWMDICCIYVCVQHVCAQKKEWNSPGTELIDGCEPPRESWQLTWIFLKTNKFS